MTNTNATKVVLGLSVAGTLFAGYLSFSSLILKRCAFGEPCPQLFGLPSCLYGFAFFLIIALLAAAMTFGWLERRLGEFVAVVIAAGGFVFAWRYAIPEFGPLFAGHRYAMGLPVCAWGAVFFTAALVFAVVALRAGRRPVPSPIA